MALQNTSFRKGYTSVTGGEHKWKTKLTKYISYLHILSYRATYSVSFESILEKIGHKGIAVYSQDIPKFSREFET